MGELIVVGDRILVQPIDGEQQTESGIVLPATVNDKDRIRHGRVVRVGPGHITANPEYSDEPWRKPHDAVRYLPLQAQPGDLAYFTRKEATEFSYQGKQYLIVPHGAVLVLVRPGAKDVLESLQDMLESE
jgi:chaperonin GroES